MNIGLRVDRRSVIGWHRWLCERLTSEPTRTARLVDTHLTSAIPTSVERLLTFEAKLRQRPIGDALRPLSDEAVSSDARESDLIIDLVGDGAACETNPATPVWHIRTDGVAGEGALQASIARGHCPVVQICHGKAVLAAGRVGSESAGLLNERMEDVLARVGTLIAAAIDGRGPLLPAGIASPSGGGMRASQAAVAAAGIFGRRLARRLERGLFRTPYWRVGWRRLDGPDLIGLRSHPARGWRNLPDDGACFYADPFPLERNGTVTLFVEDFRHASRRACISAVAFGPEGPLGRPEPVLERPYHLSYPFVFERDGEAWMIPEGSEARTVDLFRATRYPGGWVKEATLLRDIVASDATLHETDDGWWMFATVKDGGSYSDALHLWHAPDFRGPWTPHAGNPVLVDIASARPAGRMVLRDGVLYRPVQDCRDGYGAALGLARVTQLNARGFAQTVEAILTAGPLWPGNRIHTLNQAGGLEFIDGSHRARWNRAT